MTRITTKIITFRRKKGLKGKIEELVPFKLVRGQNFSEKLDNMVDLVLGPERHEKLYIEADNESEEEVIEFSKKVLLRELETAIHSNQTSEEYATEVVQNHYLYDDEYH